MKLKMLLAIAIAAAMAPFVPKTAVAGTAQPSYCNPCLFYGGDLNPNDPNANGLANEMDLTVNTGSTIYTPFVVGGGGWNVTGLFTDNLMNIDALSATWEIRTGVSSGNGGNLIAFGSGTPTVTDTGINAFGFEDYAVEVSTGDGGVYLPPGTYWESVVPVCTDSGDPNCGGRSFQADTDGTNAYNFYGPPEPQNDSFWNSSFFGENFTLINSQNIGAPIDPIMSAGVIGTLPCVAGDTSCPYTPEPSSLLFLATGLAGLAGAARRRFGK